MQPWEVLAGHKPRQPEGGGGDECGLCVGGEAHPPTMQASQSRGGWQSSARLIVGAGIAAALAAAALLEVRRRRHAAAKLHLQGTRPRDRKSRGAFPEHIRLQIQARLAFSAREALKSLSIGVEDEHAASSGRRTEGIEEWDTVLIDTPQALIEAVEELEKEKTIAYDSEHHHYYSYRGHLCLIQLSAPSRKKIYLVDPIKLDATSIQTLLGRRVLENETIVKIVHGGDNDVLWLQKDFNIFMVNVFDTQRATKALGYERHGLSSLLEQHFGVSKDSELQKADWRQRPLADKLVSYAGTDVRYLVSLKDILVRELLQRSTDADFMSAYRRSQKVALQTYREATGRPSDQLARGVLKRAQQKGWIKHVGVRKKDLNRLRLRLRSILEWRNASAEQMDVSLHAMLPDSMAVQLSALTVEDIEETATGCAVLMEFLRETSAEYANGNSYFDRAKFLSLFTIPVIQALWEAYNRSDEDAPKNGSDEGKAQALRGEKSVASSRRSAFVERFTSKKKAYENCKMLSVEGEVLCFCDSKKARWYIERGLADQISEDPIVIQLKFQHKTEDQQTKDGAFYCEKKANRCVSCGESRYLRYRVIPSCYRKSFPVEFKSHRSHDIVLLCVNCHEIANSSAEAIKRDIAESEGIPLNLFRLSRRIANKEDLLFEFNSSSTMREAYKAALALTHHGHAMPETRVTELKAHIAAAYEIATDDANEEHIIGILKLSRSSAAKQALDKCKGVVTTKERAEPSGQYLHGKLVVTKLLQRGGQEALVELIKRFRREFVASVQPKYLPASWSVEHWAERQFGEFSVYQST